MITSTYRSVICSLGGLSLNWFFCKRSPKRYSHFPGKEDELNKKKENEDEKTKIKTKPLRPRRHTSHTSFKHDWPRPSSPDLLDSVKDGVPSVQVGVGVVQPELPPTERCDGVPWWSPAWPWPPRSPTLKSDSVMEQLNITYTYDIKTIVKIIKSLQNPT